MIDFHYPPDVLGTPQHLRPPTYWRAPWSTDWGRMYPRTYFRYYGEDRQIRGDKMMQWYDPVNLHYILFFPGHYVHEAYQQELERDRWGSLLMLIRSQTRFGMPALPYYRHEPWPQYHRVTLTDQVLREGGRFNIFGQQYRRAFESGHMYIRDRMETVVEQFFTDIITETKYHANYHELLLTTDHSHDVMPYYEFRLFMRNTVAGMIKCSCEDCTVKQKFCKHLLFFLDKILPPDEENSIFNLGDIRLRGHKSKEDMLNHLDNMVRNMGNEMFPEGLYMPVMYEDNRNGNRNTERNDQLDVWQAEQQLEMEQQEQQQGQQQENGNMGNIEIDVLPDENGFFIQDQNEIEIIDDDDLGVEEVEYWSYDSEF